MGAFSPPVRSKESTMRTLVVGLTLLALNGLPAAAQQQIGTAKSVRPAAHGSVAGTLSVGAGVHANENIRTDPAGVAGLQFRDQTNLDVGPSSTVRLDRFIYYPNRGTGAVIINATLV